MRDVFAQRRGRDAQTFVFFALTFGTIVLLCGLAIDSGLLFLAKARMGRAVDGASLAAVGNFNRSSDPATNRSSVATIMRNFAVANYTDLGYSHNRYYSDSPISATATEMPSSYITTTGQTAYNYTFNFNDGTTDPNGQFRKFVKVVLTTGSGGQITSATCSSRCPVNTYFLGALGPFFRDLKVSSESVATRNPRLIAIVIDRSASMLAGGGGAYGLPQAVVQFLDFFDTSSDYITIVSFGSNARVEMALTTNFINAGTNVLFDAYQTNNGVGIPGADPEEFTTNGYSATEVADYAYSGVRRLKFGGQTAADEGMRLGMEQLMGNAGFNDPDVVKYIVLFTDGAWNETRTLLAAPPYKNVVLGPPLLAVTATNALAVAGKGWTNNTLLDSNLIAVPTFSETTPSGLTDLTNAINYNNGATAFNLSTTLGSSHIHDVWQSIDGSTYEPLAGSTTASAGAPLTFTNSSILGTNALLLPVYAKWIDVWLQPGAIDRQYHNGAISNVWVSNPSYPTNHIAIQQTTGDSNVLTVPGYLIDGLFFDGLDLTWVDNTGYGASGFPRYRVNNFNEYFMWPDDITPAATQAEQNSYASTVSLERNLMFRNYPNLLTGFYISKPDDPSGPAGDVDPYTGALRPSNGLGPYYPGAPVYWPFDLVGIDYDPTYVLTNATVDPDFNGSGGGNGGSRHGSYTMNMQSAAAAPEWAGEWFFSGTNGTSTISTPGNTALSSLMTSKAMWQSNAPAWLLSDFDASGENIMTNESAHNTNIIPTASVWRPSSYSGVLIGTTNPATTLASIVAAHPSSTGGYTMDGAGNVYGDSMAYSGRPTHYFDFSRGEWVTITNNHVKNIQALPLGVWKAQEYAWHARAQGVIVYTVGYGYLVSPAQQVILAQMANSTNTTAGNVQGFDSTGTNFVYNDMGGTAMLTINQNQPIGQQFFSTNDPTGASISNDFYQIGQAINAALTQ